MCLRMVLFLAMGEISQDICIFEPRSDSKRLCAVGVLLFSREGRIWSLCYVSLSYKQAIVETVSESNNYRYVCNMPLLENWKHIIVKVRFIVSSYFTKTVTGSDGHSY